MGLAWEEGVGSGIVRQWPEALADAQHWPTLLHVAQVVKSHSNKNTAYSKTITG